MRHYRIVRIVEDRSLMEKEVSRFLEEGYKLHGDLQYLAHRQDGYTCWVYLQALIRETK